VAATRGWRGEAPRQGARVPAGDRLLGWVASTSRAWTGNEGGGLASAVQALCAPGSQCVMFGPLRAGGQVVGALGVMSYAPHTFTPEEFEVFSAIGGMFGVAVENARLYEEARANLTQIAYFNDVGSALTASLDLERVLQIIMERITTLIGVERASIFLIDDNTNDLVLEYSFGGHESIRLPAPWPGIVGWIAARGTSAIVNDVHNDPRFLADIDAATRFDTRSILGAPLKLDERVIGVVEMLNKLEGPFAERDRKLLVDFSKWAAIALHNARLYRELNEARERLANAEAVAVMGDMALNLTHELSNRISLVTPTLSRMRAKCQAELSNPYLDRKLKVIGRVADESKTIIRRIREPFEVADEQPVNPAECLAEAIGSFQMRPGIKVIERYQRDLPPVMATREKLTQAFCHIIGNALDAMGERGELLLSTRRRLDGLLEVVISDDGPGMPEATQKRVFDLGFTTKGDQGGLGLGLWWTRMYVNRLRGQVKLQSTPGRGTVVSIRLPTLGEKSP
jgi:signal transduction histidine kinase